MQVKFERTDEVVVEAARQVESYDAFYRRELSSIIALTAAVTANPMVAEDLAQEALVKAYKQWDRISVYDKPGAWVRRVAINMALSARKRAAAELRVRLGMRPEPTLLAAPSQHQYVWDAVASLPGQQRAAMALHYLEDRPVAEIATILDCSESTARVHLHRGRQAMAKILEEK